MKLQTATDEIQSNKRNTAPNPFMEADTLASLQTGGTFRIDFDKNDKPHRILSWLRDAAKSVGKTVVYRVDETDNAGDTVKLTDATYMRVKFADPRPRKTSDGTADKPATKTAGKRK